MRLQIWLKGRRAAMGMALFIVSVLFLLIVGGPAYANNLSAPLLWGVDEDSSILFSIENYNSAAPELTSYGALQFGGGSVPDEVEGLAIDKFGIMYLSLNDDIDGVDDPVLLTFDTKTAVKSTGVGDNPNSVVVNGKMNGFDRVNGLAIDPLTEQLYGLAKDDGDWVLFRIDDTSNPNAVTVIEDDLDLEDTGEELEFDERGNLFITDDNSDTGNILYRVGLSRDGSNVIDGVASLSKEIADIEDEFDDQDRVKMEGLAWDPINDIMLAFSDRGNFWANLLGTGAVSEFPELNDFGLTDVEGIAFEQYSRSQVPESGTMILLGFGLLGLAGLKRKIIK